MQKVEIVGLCVLAVVCLAHIAQAYPQGRRRAWYECYCPGNRVCGRFTCENYEYTCHCKGCSCFASIEDEGKFKHKPSENGELRVDFFFSLCYILYVF